MGVRDGKGRFFFSRRGSRKDASAKKTEKKRESKKALDVPVTKKKQDPVKRKSWRVAHKSYLLFGNSPGREVSKTLAMGRKEGVEEKGGRRLTGMLKINDKDVYLWAEEKRCGTQNVGVTPIQAGPVGERKGGSDILIEEETVLRKGGTLTELRGGAALKRKIFSFIRWNRKRDKAEAREGKKLFRSLKGAAKRKRKNR